MPITKGAGNPPWTWDETLLALDLLYAHTKPIDRSHTDVGELSRLLRAAPFVEPELRKENFRNSDGVALKLQNLWSALHPGKGLSSSKRDKAVVAAFPPYEQPKLRIIADQIRQAVAERVELGYGDLAEDEVFLEGWIITAKHRFRDRRLRARLLEKRGPDGLCCEICDFTPPDLPLPIRQSFFEAHHKLPLTHQPRLASTTVKDMALLCAGCHRFIHRLMVFERVWISVEQARHRLA